MLLLRTVEDYTFLYLMINMMKANLFISIGLIVFSIGVILYFFPNAFKWFGNLPGDFKSRGDNVSFYFPLASMIVVSIVFNIIFRIYRYFL